MKLAKKCPLFIMLLLSAMLWSNSSHANNFYWELNVGSGTFKPEVGTSEDITVISGSFGGFITQLFSYEIQLATGWEDQGGFGNSSQVTHGAGMVGLNIGSRDAHVFLMGGIGLFAIDTTINNVDGDGLAIGFGVNLYANDQSGLTFEVLNINDTDNGEYGILSLGYKKKF